MGNKNSGQPGGNPNIRNIRKTGAITPEGKLKTLITSRMLIPKSNSKILNMFKHCDKCPLGARELKDVDARGNDIKVFIPAKCNVYEKGSDCNLDQGMMIKKLQVYFKIGEEGDTLQLQRALTYGMLENAELAKMEEIATENKPGNYAARFQEIAAKNLTDINRIQFGEKRFVATADVTDKISQDQALKEFIDIRAKKVDEEENGEREA